MNKNAAYLLLTIAMLDLSTSVALAETPNATKMLGVSSAWSGGEPMKSRPLQTGKLHLTPPERISDEPARLPRIQSSIQLNQKAKRAAQSSGETRLFNEKSFELVLDNWQTNFRHLLADAPPRLTAFSSWVSQQMGFSKRGTVSNFKMAPSPVIRVHLQPITNNHSDWLTSDGRLKTVTSH